MYADAGEPRQPLGGVRFNEVPGLMLEKPATPSQLSSHRHFVGVLTKIKIV